jgi:hypothetical protein
LLRETLDDDNYLLIKIDAIEDFSEGEFDDANYILMSKAALENNEVYYGDFPVWDKESRD